MFQGYGVMMIQVDEPHKRQCFKAGKMQHIQKLKTTLQSITFRKYTLKNHICMV